MSAVVSLFQHKGLLCESLQSEGATADLHFGEAQSMTIDVVFLHLDKLVILKAENTG